MNKSIKKYEDKEYMLCQIEFYPERQWRQNEVFDETVFIAM